MDPVLLSRIQFAFTIGFHFLFVPLSLGLSLAIVAAERRYRRSGSPSDRAASDFWIRLFTSTFAIGVATGITMEFSFGTNWAGYSRFVGDVFGAPLAAEALFSFFLESTFLGVLLFGRGRVSGRFYYAATWLVALGAHLSALWIVIANSWQQTPAGYEVVGGRAVLTDFFAAMMNPSTLPRFSHAVVATWVAGAFFVAGVCAYYLRRGRHREFALAALKPALAFALVASLAMPVIGHWHAGQVWKTQPAKLAAFEGRYESGPNAGMSLFGWVDEDRKRLRFALVAPDVLSFALGGSADTVVAGLDSFPAADRPPVQFTFQTYHLMVALGLYFIAVAALGLYLALRGRLERQPFFLRVLAWSIPLPLLANEVGWAAAEVGRQPWIVYGELRTSDAVSVVVPASHIALSLGLFAAVYALLFAAWLRVVVGIIRRGPAVVEEA
ncbi:MAG TPA: cytochrome ubiquinol oxidase subunit I [Thermoleophilia bacterium]|nr:cytochrome ubiquinol oxidase subunit I [Thermoleophilia bacterium]